MRVALPIWHDRVAPVFDTATTLTIFSCEQNCSAVETLEVASLTIHEKIALLQSHGIETLICGAFPFRYETLFKSTPVTVHSFIAGEVQEVLSALLSNTLDAPQFKMPGCKGRERRNRIQSVLNRSHCESPIGGSVNRRNSN